MPKDPEKHTLKLQVKPQYYVTSTCTVPSYISMTNSRGMNNEAHKIFPPETISVCCQTCIYVTVTPAARFSRPSLSPSTHASPPSLLSSLCHSPAFPSSLSDLMSSLAQAPLGSTVTCGAGSHSR